MARSMGDSWESGREASGPRPAPKESQDRHDFQASSSERRRISFMIAPTEPRWENKDDAEIIKGEPLPVQRCLSLIT